jgi:putative PEP-CTERM system histidine kinase
VTTATFVTASTWSYGLAAAGYLAFAARISIGSRKSVRALLLVGALLATALWALLAVSLVLGIGGPVIIVAHDASNALRYGLWFAFVAHLLARPALAEPAEPPAGGRAVLVVAILLASVVLGNGLPLKDVLGIGSRGAFGFQLALAIVGLIFVEQLVRRVEPQRRWGVKPLAVALAGIFGFDLYLFADAMLFGHLDADVWVARGVANLLVIPFVAVATVRNSGWTVDLHVSRKAIFHSSALLVSGVFLLLVAGAGYFVRYLGGDWGRALEIELLFAAGLAIALVGTSGSFRSRLRVFVSKHFFSYRYDYREEWLRFTRTLATESASPRVHERTVAALADLVESPAGVLWLRDETRGYAVAARWNGTAIDASEPRDGSLVSFLERTGWIVSVPEYRADPARYAGLELPAWLDAMAAPWLVVPLASGANLLGFVVLATPRTPVEVDWEVRDLLKTASRQAATYLGEIVATEALLEARKFDAFNRMSAFVVHDLKNLVAQLSLMLRNAERHRDNPRFQEDMLATVQHVVARMNALMLQLRTGAEPVDKPGHVELVAVVGRVCRSKAGGRTPIDFDARGDCAVLGHEDRLEHVIGHLVQNAIDASPLNARVRVALHADDRDARVVVSDEGAGMTPEFIRDRLFRPFQTTKATGMGIGVYESAQYLSRIGGDLQIDSKPGAGTRVTVRLPRVAPSAAEPAVEEHAA